MFAILIFLLVLSVLVLIHELGHFVAAKICGVKAEEFGYGFPPRALGFVKENGKWKRVKARDQKSYPGTIWSINWLPLGGFVRLKGEQGDHEHDRDSFLSKGPIKKLFILSAGVIMNWILAAVIFTVAFAIGVPTQTDNLPKGAVVQGERIQITEVVPESAAAKAGIVPGDFLIAVGQGGVKRAQDAQTAIQTHALDSEGMTISVIHDGQTKTLTVKPAYIESLKRAGLGVALADTGIVRFPWYQAIGQGIKVTWMYTKLILVGLYGLIHDLITQRRVTADVSGPVGIAVMTGHIARQGIWALAQFTALLSINLAIVNFLPIPALDGGRALFVFIESLRRRRNNPRFEAWTHQIGFILLLALIAVVTFHDLRQYGGVIVRGLKGIIGL